MFLNLLYASNETSDHLWTNLTASEAFLIIIVVAVAGMIVQMRLRSVMAKYSNEQLPAGLTGAQIAAKMLAENNIHDVKIVHKGGFLTDYYDPRNKTVNLSDEIYNGSSITAAAVACHECGHAIQHAVGYGPLQLRTALVPVVNVSSRLATWVVIGGLIMTATAGSEIICWIGVGLMCMSALFSIVTLPVEYNASNRALAWLESSNTLAEKEMQGATVALRWAARTYLVAALSAIASILYYIALINGRRR